MRKIVISLLCIVCGLSLQAQKKVLDHSVFDSWQAVSHTAVSPGGNVISYEVNPQEGDGTLTFRVADKKAERIIEIPRGYRATVLEDERYAVCLIKPYFQKTRRARIDKKKPDQMPKDSLAVIDLRSGSIVKFPDVKSYKTGKYASQAFAFATADTTFIPKKERKNKDIGSPLAVYYFADGRLDTLRNVSDYAFSKDGLQLALVRQLGKQKMNPGFYDIAAHKAVFGADTTAWLGLPVFDEAGARALYLSAADTLTSGSKHASLYLWNIGTGSGRLLVGEAGFRQLPENWGLTENSKPSFSHNGQHIFVGVQEFEPPKDTSLVSFETPGLDIWNWDAPQLPPFQKANLKQNATRTYLCKVLDGQLVPYSVNPFTRVSLSNRGDEGKALLVTEDNPVETQWNIQNTRTAQVSGTAPVTGKFSDIRLSPLGKYLSWWNYEDRKWYVQELESGAVKQLAPDVDVIWWDQEHDSPSVPDAYGMGGWLEDDSAVLMYDRFDIWKVPMDGSAPVRLTAGRESGLTYRVINLKDATEERHIGLEENLLLSVFNHSTKENGLATVNVGRKPAFRTLVSGGFTWSGIKKARKAPVYIYQKGNFREPMDVFAATVPGSKERKLTAINPQIADYNWGTAELYHWTAFDGTPLDGLLYKPEDFDAGKRYPVIIYFYERNSETLYNHIRVQPMWSIINIPFFVSRGYVVFVPDIVYKAGIPGECAYNCIVSGAESLRQFPWIDDANMAIQGQSWGGYQVAYLITRTGMFKAAGAGAPVANMTSAYGGIRWESGMSRQFQYEQTQSRIGRDLWNGLELYMENSPLFKLPNVTTPVLIMHNDNDGAVPWYQGIEMFMGLRRLGKPAWLLEYNNEAHNLRERRNRKDLSIRLQQFFDHYLTGAPEPAWMRDGVPTAKKEYYFGY